MSAVSHCVYRLRASTVSIRTACTVFARPPQCQYYALHVPSSSPPALHAPFAPSTVSIHDIVRTACTVFTRFHSVNTPCMHCLPEACTVSAPGTQCQYALRALSSHSPQCQYVVHTACPVSKPSTVSTRTHAPSSQVLHSVNTGTHCTHRLVETLGAR